MISQLNSSAVSNLYTANQSETKAIKSNTTVSKQGDMSKIEKIESSIASGEYKINLESLSKKIADGLL